MAALFLLPGVVPLSGVRADPAVEVVTQGSESSGGDTDVALVRPSPRVEIYTQFTTGYDDNFQTRSNSRGAFFTDPQVTLSYRTPNPNQELSLLAGIGVDEYPGERTNLNSFIDFAFARPITRRLTFSTTLDFAYRSEPNFATNVGPSNFRGNYYTLDLNLAASYALTRRISLVSSYSLELVRYEDSFTAALTDRQTHSFGEQFRYAYTRTTFLTLDYRFQIVDYVTAPRDSTTHFILAGIEHAFTRDLRGELRAGASIRSLEFGGDQVNPDVEWSLNYRTGRDDLAWTGSYAVEESNTVAAQDQTTFRTGLLFSHEFTERFRSALALYYHHDNFQQLLPPFLVGPASSQDAVDLNASLHYQVSSRFGVDLTYSHSQVFSAAAAQPAYARNRYSLGMSYRF